jgi:hypothetical protein
MQRKRQAAQDKRQWKSGQDVANDMMDAQKEKKLCFFKNTSQIKNLRYCFRNYGQFGFCLHLFTSVAVTVLFPLLSLVQNTVLYTVLCLNSMGSHH